MRKNEDAKLLLDELDYNKNPVQIFGVKAWLIGNRKQKRRDCKKGDIRTLFIWSRNMNKLIVIIGMHRSGTSALAQIISKLGVYMGEKEELVGAEPSNEDGHFELWDALNIHEELFAAHNRSWNSIYRFPDEWDDKAVDHAKKKIRETLDRLFQRSNTVGIKDPRICLFLPIWEEVFHRMDIEPIYIYIVRPAGEVAASLWKRDGMPEWYARKLWTYYNICAQRFLYEKNVICIHYDDLFRQNIYDTISMAIFGRTAEKEETKGVVKESLRHQNIGTFDLNETEHKLYEKRLSKDELETLFNATFSLQESKTRWIEELDRERLKGFSDDRESCLVVYGAGYYGSQAAVMLRDLGINEVTFCDRDKNKIGSSIEGFLVEGAESLTIKQNPHIIMALKGNEAARRAALSLPWLNDADFISFSLLQKIWNETVELSYLDFVSPMYIRQEREFSKLYKYLDKYMYDITNVRVPLFKKNDVPVDHVIWVLWLQGLSSAPEIVKACINSIEKSVPAGYQFILLSEENLYEYVALPDFVMKKYKTGLISRTGFSDIIRVELLSIYGGCWIDATVFCLAQIKNYMIKGNIFLFKSNLIGGEPVRKLSTWWMASKAGNEFILKTREIILRYIENEDWWKDYFIMSVVMSKLADIDPICRKEFYEIPYIHNGSAHLLWSMIQNTYDSEEWEMIKEVCPVQKLSYKREFKGNNSHRYYDVITVGIKSEYSHNTIMRDRK